MSTHNKQVPVCIIIGASHAGVNCAFTLRNEGWKGHILLFDGDKHLPYHRPPLSKKYLIDDTPIESYALKPKDSYETANITLKLGLKVIRIDGSSKHVILENGALYYYDKLVLAVGAYPILPPAKGIQTTKRLFTLRTANDIKHIRQALLASKQKRVVIIGGGYIGLETAASIRSIGAEVTVLEREERLLSRVTSTTMSDFFMTLHKQKNVTILTGCNVTEISTEDNCSIVHCDDEQCFNADIIIVGVGVRVNTELAESAELEIENGIKIDEFTRTNDDNIHAIGDCTYHYNAHYERYIRLESVQNAVEQAKVAAKFMCNKIERSTTIPWFWSDQYDVKLQTVGLSAGYDNVLVRQEQSRTNCFSVWYTKQGSVLAVEAINNSKAYVIGTKLIKLGQTINQQSLINADIPLKIDNLID